MFTRRHYERIARVIKSRRYQMGASCASLAQAFEDEFRADNPRFDGDKFLAACGFERIWTDKAMGACFIRLAPREADNAPR